MHFVGSQQQNRIVPPFIPKYKDTESGKKATQEKRRFPMDKSIRNQ